MHANPKQLLTAALGISDTPRIPVGFPILRRGAFCMNPNRRRTLQTALGALLLPATAWSQPGSGGETHIRINIPGPHSLPFLPIDLIPALNFDREMGARLSVRYQPSGIRAIEDVLAGNADLAALGFATLPTLHSRGKDIVAISPLSGHTPPMGIVLHKDLAKKVRSVADLKGRTIATSTGSVHSKTYLQMAAQAVLRANGVADNEVRWLPTAQNWDSISGAMISKACDAIFCEEPFTSRLVRDGHGVILADLADPRMASKIPGLNHIRSAIVTTRALTRSQPEKMEMFVRMLRRTLMWIQATPPEQVALKAPANVSSERLEIAALLRKMPGIFSPDGRFSVPQIAETDVFLRNAMPELKLAAADSLIDDRWAGRRQ
jgi:NitT/TauT family transport system substrate-binding protein